ncbi:PAS domain-containing protein [Martelella limonii]|uniref:PAS domain-containing protein n=1 Tax=Martelella limonii TaxID=1647649 RepID=UPI0015803AF9|nr:PAS domain-containing protein [Martelella limonii]
MQSSVGSGNALVKAALNITPKGVVSYWSKGAELLLGYAADEIVGGNIFERLVPSRDQAGFVEHLSLAELTSDGASFEFPCLHKVNRSGFAGGSNS